ncbi:EamA family transporter [Methylobacterium sp. J-072]|uniref:DMT family transporter n=1 Tax=Methylobacterium sp. J-072 TaxID=2836651 RepID=UPI001FBB4550|nr:EamA family transporter [Methylobacterium sp. J-072]MCJ2094122.1 EamA family transporter [Methylobacterium sp. J-072]
MSDAPLVDAAPRREAGSSRILAFTAMAFIWGAGWLPTKLAMEVLPPIFFACLRFSFAALGFLVMARLRGFTLRVERPGRVLAASMLITTACYALVFWGLAQAPSGLAAVVNLGLMPIFLIGIGAAYGQEPITPRRIAAIVLGLAGLALLFSGRLGGGGEGGQAALGLGAVALGTFAYAWGTVISRPLVRVTPPVVLAFWQSGLGTLGLIPICLAVEGWDPGHFAAIGDPRVLQGLAVMVGGGSLIAFPIFLMLLSDWGAFRAGLYAFVSPVIAVLVGYAFAGERIDAAEAVGMTVTLAATALALSRPRRTAT